MRVRVFPARLCFVKRHTDIAMVKTVGLLTRDRIAPAETVAERMFRSVPDSLKGLFPE